VDTRPHSDRRPAEALHGAWLPAVERRQHTERRHGGERRHHVVREGVVVAGMGATVALAWLLVAGAWRGRLLETPLDLGAYLMRAAGGAGSANATELATFYVLLHYLAFVPIGFVGVALVHGPRRCTLPVALGAMSLTAGGLITLLIAITGRAAVDRFAWANVVVAALAALLTMGCLLRRSHRFGAALGRSRRERSRRRALQRRTRRDTNTRR